MGRRSSSRDSRMRELLVQEAARIMADEGLRDFYMAKRKAAERLGASATGNLPQNREIQAALADYQRLFRGEQQARRLQRMREAALEAMAFFERFRPRLVGPVLDGTADEYSDVNLHVFADAPDEVALFLLEQRIPFETEERRYRFGREEYEFVPVHRFVAGDVRMDLAVFDRRSLGQPPRSRVDGQPVRRAGPEEVRRLLVE